MKAKKALGRDQFMRLAPGLGLLEDKDTCRTHVGSC
jgi:hypothetical protein